MILFCDPMSIIWINPAVLLKTNLRTASLFWSAPVRVSWSATTSFYPRFSTSCNKIFCKLKNIIVLDFMAFHFCCVSSYNSSFPIQSIKTKQFSAQQAVVCIQMNHHWYRLQNFIFLHISSCS